MSPSFLEKLVDFPILRKSIWPKERKKKKLPAIESIQEELY